MSRIRFRAQIEKIDGGKIFYSLPERVYPSEVFQTHGVSIIDPANPKEEFLQIRRAAYVGSKRRLKKRFAEIVPGEVNTVFDPMCGFSSFLRELGENGVAVWGNDLNPIPFWFSKALFLAQKPKMEDFERFLSSGIKIYDGFFSSENVFPTVKIPIRFRKFIDGFIKAIDNSDHPTFLRGIMAAYLSNIAGSYGGPYAAENRVHGFGIARLKECWRQIAKEIISCDVCGKVTNMNALTMEIPNVDLIYFDPPYWDENPKYFRRYRKMNSILLQRDWIAPQETTQDDIRELSRRLAAHSPILMISTTKDCPISWKKELKDPRRSVFQKRFRIPGAGLENQKLATGKRMSEILWISAEKKFADIVKTGDPFMLYPSPEAPQDYVLQLHFRGKSVHGDLRLAGLPSGYLLGWTLMIQRAGKIQEPVLTMQDARRLVRDSTKYFKIDLKAGEWAKRSKTGMKAGSVTRVSIVASRKAPEPSAWKDFEGVTKPGSVGATKNYPGVFLIIDRGKVEWGSQKTWLHEYYFDGKVLKKGRYFFRQLKAWKTEKKSSEEGDEINTLIREAILEIFENQGDFEIPEAFVVSPGKEEGLGPEIGWLFIKPIDQIPYVLSSRSAEEDWLPPKGFSALPASWKKEAKEDERYWTMDGSKALEARLAFRDRLKKDGVLRKAQRGEVNPFSQSVSKARHRRDQCMRCSKAPEIEILWAGGRAHAWFCFKHFEDWIQEEPDRIAQDLSAAKLVRDGVASRKWSENPNSDIKDFLRDFVPNFGTREKTLQMQEDKSIVADYRLTYQWWKEVKVIREGPSRHRYHIWFRFSNGKVLDFSVNDSILENESTGGILYKDRDSNDFEKDGYVKPGTKLNMTKDTTSFIKVQDRGKAIFSVDDPDLKKVQFDGSQLKKAMFLFKNIEGYWEVKRVRGAPGEEK
jgi:hypothetical protein